MPQELSEIDGIMGGQRLKEVKERGTHYQLIHPQKPICELLGSFSCMAGTERNTRKKQFPDHFFSLQNEVELGELLLSLNYLPSAGRLNVDVIRAKQLLQTDVSQGSGTVRPPHSPVSLRGICLFDTGTNFLFLDSGYY